MGFATVEQCQRGLDGGWRGVGRGLAFSVLSQWDDFVALIDLHHCKRDNHLK